MVFQSYAIWPHMDVFNNVAFPLTQGNVRLPGAEVRERVHQALQLVRLEGLEKRPAPQLSGGQQQRLALARALVREPKALLLDEPLSNLDAKLRDEMRVELKLLTQRLNITTIFVTHDQLEALTLSDQIAIMQEGHIIQMGTPQEIYSAPATKFAAEFIGTTNMFDGKVTSTADGALHVATKEGPLSCSSHHAFAEGDEVAVAIRPENVQVSDGEADGRGRQRHGGNGGDVGVPGGSHGLPHCCGGPVDPGEPASVVHGAEGQYRLPGHAAVGLPGAAHRQRGSEPADPEDDGVGFSPARIARDRGGGRVAGWRRLSVTPLQPSRLCVKA